VAGVESTIERCGKRAGQQHLPPGLLLLSVNCEHVEDLWHLLLAAIDAASPPGIQPSAGCSAVSPSQ
jgi:cystathionine gamma-synthase